MNKVMLVVVLALVVGGYYFLSPDKPAQDTIMAEPIGQEGTTPTETASGDNKTTMLVGEVQEFTVVGSEMKFDVTEIKVKKGDTVKITFINGGKFSHDWVVDEFEARTQVIGPQETEEITFVADQAGTFEYYCSVMQHRAQGMVGRLIVE